MARLTRACLVLAILAFLALAFVSVSAAPRKKNYYEILEVEKDAAPKDIKRSYFKLAMKFHPDKNPDVKDRSLLEAHFAELSHAYQVLSGFTTRERYDELLKQGVKVYTTEEMKQDERKSEMGEEWKDSFELFEEAERMTAEEERQVMIDKAILLSMSMGIVGIGVWYILSSRRLRRAVGIPNASSNVNTSREMQQSIGQDREKQLEELEKLRLKEEKEKENAQKIMDIVERRRLALAEEELARLEAEEDERARQKAIARARMEESGEQEPDVVQEEEPFWAEDAPASKAHKTASFACKPCKKTFKSEEQLENHFASKKHKVAMKEFEKEAKKNGKGGATTVAAE
jgi:curved DNA-binding protein CbpA